MSDRAHDESAATPPPRDVCPDCGRPTHGDGDPIWALHTRESQDTNLTRGQWTALIVATCFILTAIIGSVAEKALTEDRPGYPDKPVITAHLQVGDCVERTVEVDGVPTLPEVPCDQPHESEVVGAFPPSGSYPGVLVDPEGWSERCADLLQAYAPAAAAAFASSYVLPTEEQWNDPAHRVVCMATDFTMRIGSVKTWRDPMTRPSAVAA